MELERVVQALGSLRVTLSASEYDLHKAIASALETHGIQFHREANLLPGSRIDFLTDGGVGIEVKKGKPVRKALLQQLQRYCASPQITALLVVVERSVILPRNIAGKPCKVLSLHALWGIALP